MWNSKKSTVCSLVCTRAVMVLLIIAAVFLPKLIGYYFSSNAAYRVSYLGAAMDQAGGTTLMVTLYLCCIPAAAALICLDRLLSNIMKGSIFIDRNVKFLRVISWCCFLVGAILLILVRYYIFFICAAIIVALMGLIVRVVKNVIEEAVVIKKENDYTI